MRINGNEPHNESLKLAQHQGSIQTSLEERTPKGPSAGAAAGSVTGDSTAISQTASMVSKTMLLPELDTARVGELRQAIADGSYPVDTSRTATALIQSMLN